MRIILALFILAASIQSHAVENDFPPELSNVVSIGYWKSNGKEGYLRFVTKTYGSEHVFSKLYVQWITYHIDGEKKSEIVSEVGIKELNENYYSFFSPRCEGGWKCTNYSLEATHSFSNKEYLIELMFPEVGSYKYTEKTL